MLCSKVQAPQDPTWEQIVQCIVEQATGCCLVGIDVQPDGKPCISVLGGNSAASAVSTSSSHIAYLKVHKLVSGKNQAWLLMMTSLLRAIDGSGLVAATVTPNSCEANPINCATAVAALQLAAQVLSDPRLLPVEPTASSRLKRTCIDTLSSHVVWALAAALPRPTAADVAARAGSGLNCHVTIRQLVSAAPLRHHVLHSAQGATDTRSMVALLHNLHLLPEGPAGRAAMVAALARLLQHAGEVSGHRSSSRTAPVTAGPQTAEQQQLLLAGCDAGADAAAAAGIDEEYVRAAVLQHWALRLDDVVAAASAQPPVTGHIGICAFCGTAEGRRLISCVSCLHDYHLACVLRLRLFAPDPQQLQQHPVVHSGLCLGCQGWPLSHDVWNQLCNQGMQLAAAAAAAAAAQPRQQHTLDATQPPRCQQFQGQLQSAQQGTVLQLQPPHITDCRLPPGQDAPHQAPGQQEKPQQQQQQGPQQREQPKLQQQPQQPQQPQQQTPPDLLAPCVQQHPRGYGCLSSGGSSKGQGQPAGPIPLHPAIPAYGSPSTSPAWDVIIPDSEGEEQDICSSGITVV